jgi:hypothetical protein
MSIHADQYKLYIDWNDDGDFSDANEDISAYVLSVHSEQGADGPPPIKHVAGKLAVVLDNQTSIFSSFNSSSTLYGQVDPGHVVRLTAIVESTEYILWTGKLRSINPVVNDDGTDIPIANLEAFGMLSMFVKSNAEVDVQTDQYTGVLFSALMTATAFPYGTNVDTGRTKIYNWWKKAGDNDIDVLHNLEDAELATVWENKEGELEWEDRHRLFAAMATPQATYGTGVLNIYDIEQIDPLDSIYNVFNGTIKQFSYTDDIALVTVLDVGDGGVAKEIAAGGSITLVVKCPDNYIGIKDWTMVDYAVNTASSGNGVDITNINTDHSLLESGQQATITISNTSANVAYLIYLRLHGIGIIVNDASVINKSASEANLEKYGNREYPYVSEWITDEVDGNSLLTYLLSEYQDKTPCLRFKVYANIDDVHLLDVLTRELRDRIHVTAATATFGLGINADFVIYNIQHDITRQYGKYLHSMTVSCVRAPLTELGVMDNTYEPGTIIDAEPPDDLEVYRYPVGLNVVLGAMAWKYKKTIDKAEYVYKVYANSTGEIPEYVDMSDYMSDSSFVSGEVPASWRGVNIEIVCTEQCRVFFAVRFRNVKGWSVWTDGNKTPSCVTDYVATEDSALSDIGPPEDWSIIVQKGALDNTVVGVASRPTIHARRILFLHWQIKDTSTGEWLDIDAGTDPSVVYYDGSTVSHTVSEGGKRFTKSGDPGFGTAVVGNMVLLDARQSAYDVAHTTPYWISKFEGDDPTTATWFELDMPLFVLDGETDCRLKVIKSPWEWNTNGYCGWAGGTATVANLWMIENGDNSNGDMDSQQFVSPPIDIGTANINDISIRVFFHTAYSWNDDRTYSTNIASDSGTYTDTPTGNAETNGSLVNGKLIRLFFSADAILNTPSNCYDGQLLCYCLVNTSDEEIIITLSDDFKNGKLAPTYPAVDSGEVDGLDILEEEADSV